MAAIVVLLVGVAFALVQVGALPAPQFMMRQPAPAATRDARCQQAVEYLDSQLPYLHVNPFFKTGEAAFKHSVSELVAEVPALNDEKIIVRLMRITASLGDGHTRADPEAPPLRLPRLPLELRCLDDGLFVTAAGSEYAQAVGSKVTAIGGRPVQAVYDAVAPLVAADNTVQLLSITPRYMMMPAILYGLNIIPHKDRATFGFESRDGAHFALELHPTTADPAAMISIYEQAGVERPLHEHDRQAFYWYRHLPEANAVYVQYNVCDEQEGMPFRAFVADVFGMIDREHMERLVLDLRHNGGGNESVIAPMIAAIKARGIHKAPGRLFVIIGRATYSSALQNAITLRRELNATLVGEPTGGRPNHYGEVRSFRLPNVGLRIQYSTRYWRNDPDADPSTLEPDVRAVATVAHVLAGRDPALEAALQR